MRRSYLALLLLMLSLPLAGCGGGNSVPPGTPETPEPTSEEYQSYDGAGRYGPGGAPSN